MSVLLLLLTAAMAALLDLTFSPGLPVLGGHPSFCVALLAVWIVTRPRHEAMIMAPAAGLLLGLLGNEPLGASVLGLIPVVLLGMGRDPDGERPRLTVTLTLALMGGAAYTAIIALVGAVAAERVPPALVTLEAMIGTALGSALPALMLYWLPAWTARQPSAHGEMPRF